MDLNQNCILCPHLRELLWHARDQDTTHTKVLSKILGLSEATVNSYWKEIKRFLDVSERYQAVLLAKNYGWLDECPLKRGGGEAEIKFFANTPLLGFPTGKCVRYIVNCLVVLLRGSFSTSQILSSKRSKTMKLKMLFALGAVSLLAASVQAGGTVTINTTGTVVKSDQFNYLTINVSGTLVADNYWTVPASAVSAIGCPDANGVDRDLTPMTSPTYSGTSQNRSFTDGKVHWSNSPYAKGDTINLHVTATFQQPPPPYGTGSTISVTGYLNTNVN